MACPDFSFSELDIRTIDVNILRRLPEDFALKNKLLPFKIYEEKLYIAFGKDQSNELLSKLKLICRIEVCLVKCEEDILQVLVDNAYKYLTFRNAIINLESEFTTKDDSKKNTETESDENGAPAVIIVDYIINSAVKVGASDIHIEPEDNEVRVRYRIDGELIQFYNIPMGVYSSVITRLKVLCNMDISEKRLPQDGKCHHCYLQKYLDLRVSTIPTIFGEKFVIRILDKNNFYCSLENIYDDEKQRKRIKTLLNSHGGIILSTGPTGSGKSTTLYAMINELNKNNMNITTIEDPVEYTMKGINQINVNSKLGLTFAAGLRSILRQDPDIIMVGEIRDEETALIAIRAAITGHLVLSTLHTNTAMGTINRLVEMGIQRYLLADALIAVISQRLIRKICSSCKAAYMPTEAEIKILNINACKSLYKGKGCALCHHSGYKGRTVVSQIVLFDEKLKRKMTSTDLNFYDELSGGEGMTEQCKKLVLSGITTVEEFIKISNIEV